MGYRLGVDLGTTFTAAAVVRPGAAPEVVPLGSRCATVPTVLFLGADGALLVGDAAERRSMTDPDRVVRRFKQRIGDETPLVVGGGTDAAEHLAHDLAALLIWWVVARVTEREGAAPEGIAVTHPATWGPHKKDLLSGALGKAGLRDVTLVTEPEAAAVSYAATGRIPQNSTLAVYDLGGGTFDAALLRTTGDGHFAALGRPHGLPDLGGIDFDDAILAHVLSSIGDAAGDLDMADPFVVTAMARLRRECVDAKEALSADTTATIPVLLSDVRTNIRLTRSELEAMISPAVLRTIAVLDATLASAELASEDLTNVLLTGGSSRIPVVAQLLSRHLGAPVSLDRDIDPKLAVAMGAALAPAGGTPRGAASAGSRMLPPVIAAAVNRGAVPSAAAVPAQAKRPTPSPVPKPVPTSTPGIPVVVKETHPKPKGAGPATQPRSVAAAAIAASAAAAVSAAGAAAASKPAPTAKAGTAPAPEDGAAAKDGATTLWKAGTAVGSKAGSASAPAPKAGMAPAPRTASRIIPLVPSPAAAPAQAATSAVPPAPVRPASSTDYLADPRLPSTRSKLGPRRALTLLGITTVLMLGSGVGLSAVLDSGERTQESITSPVETTKQVVAPVKTTAKAKKKAKASTSAKSTAPTTATRVAASDTAADADAGTASRPAATTTKTTEATTTTAEQAATKRSAAAKKRAGDTKKTAPVGSTSPDTGSDAAGWDPNEFEIDETQQQPASGGETTTPSTDGGSTPTDSGSETGTDTGADPAAGEAPSGDAQPEAPTEPASSPDQATDSAPPNGGFSPTAPPASPAKARHYRF